MVKEIVEDPGLAISAGGFILAGVSNYVTERPQFWKWWKISRVTFLLGFVLFVGGILYDVAT